MLFYDSGEDEDADAEENRTHISPDVRNHLMRQRAREQGWFFFFFDGSGRLMDRAAKSSPLNPKGKNKDTPKSAGI